MQLDSLPDGGELVHVKFSFGEAWFKRLSDFERLDKYDMWLSPKGDLNHSRLKYAKERAIAITCCNQDGTLCFDDSDKGLRLLSEKRADVIRELYQVAQGCLGLSSEDLVEVLKKKSPDSSETIDGCCISD